MTREQLMARYQGIRRQTEALCRPLDPEDCQVQSMPEASPAKWHLAHTSWFFETFVLRQRLPAYVPLDETYLHLFNSYYQAVGDPHPRPRRGVLSRPTLREVLEYRKHVDRWMNTFLSDGSDKVFPEVAAVVELGMHHEQQHQELILTDIKHVFACNPLAPAYQNGRNRPAPATTQQESWVAYEPGAVEIGHDSSAEFAFDNERPRHMHYLNPFAIAGRLVTCGEYVEFIADRGYERAELWLSDGWEAKESGGWRAPLYWRDDDQDDHRRRLFTLSGVRDLDPAEPVCHVSYYEADAFARWAEARLPTEAEWERAATQVPVSGNFMESEVFHPRPAAPPAGAGAEGKPAQLFGDVWEWTASAYLPYPGYRAPSGALGEYNGKFMVNQMVLRGGSCASPASHLRPTYRNFFPPETRWQFTGIRLAR